MAWKGGENGHPRSEKLLFAESIQEAPATGDGTGHPRNEFNLDFVSLTVLLIIQKDASMSHWTLERNPELPHAVFSAAAKPHRWRQWRINYAKRCQRRCPTMTIGDISFGLLWIPRHERMKKWVGCFTLEKYIRSTFQESNTKKFVHCAPPQGPNESAESIVSPLWFYSYC